MKNALCPLWLLAGAPCLTGCNHNIFTAPVAVETPGMPSPELALQKSIDRIHTFMTSLNERLETPAGTTRPPAISPDQTSGSPARDIHPGKAARNDPSTGFHAHEAIAINGRNGFKWFAFADGYARIHCTPGSVCMVYLQPGEVIEENNIVFPSSSGWHADPVRGSRNRLMIALAPSVSARDTTLRLITNRRTYTMALEPSGTSMMQAAFTYAPDDPQEQPDPPFNPKARNMKSGPDFDYRISGADVSWKPMRVYREDGHTYIQFPPGGITSRPRLVVISPQNTTDQSYRTIGDSYIVDQPVDNATLVGIEPGSPVVHITHGKRS